MVFVNNKVGNGFLMNSMNSSMDNEHYFDGAKKNVELKYKFVSFSSSALFTGSGGFSDFKKDSSGTLFAAYNKNISSPGSGSVLKSIDNGVSWQYIFSSASSCNKLHIDSQDRIYVAGTTRRSSAFMWMVARSSDHGDTWSIVDTLPTSGTLSGGASEAHCIATTPSGIIFAGGASGSSGIVAASDYFIIRSSSDDGVTWGIVELFSGASLGGVCRDIMAYDNDIVYAVGGYTGPGTGTKHWLVRKTSTGGATGSWETIEDIVGLTDVGSADHARAECIDISPSGAVYVGGSSGSAAAVVTGLFVRKSHVTSSVFNTINIMTGTYDTNAANKTSINDIIVDRNNESQIYAVGGMWNNYGFASVNVPFFVVQKSEDYGVSWNTLNCAVAPLTSSVVSVYSSGAAGIFDNNNFIVGGYYGSNGITIKYHQNVYVDSFNLTSSFGRSARLSPLKLLTDGNDSVIVTSSFISNVIPSDSETIISLEDANLSFEYFITGTLESVFLVSGNLAAQGINVYFKDDDSTSKWFSNTDISKKGKYVLLSDKFIRYNFDFVTDGKYYPPRIRLNNVAPLVEFRNNSGSFVIRNVELSFKHPLSNDGVKYYKNLDNQHNKKITSYKKYKKFDFKQYYDFPHSSGLFQMPNVLLGTTYSGKIGNTEDSIIQTKYIGSVVKVMWPKQDSIDKPIRGFGDFSAGERAGKLTTTFDPGDSVDVTEFDHMTLYCYLSKEVSGTLDDIIISVERKPIKSNPFAIDQAISYSLSGSKTEALLTDIEYKKQIDYGDLSINKIGFPIDIPLTNTKEVRVSVKHRLGQSEQNKNFIAWGRFIKSDKNTNET